MDTRKLHEQAQALEQLHQYHLTGENAPALSHELQTSLLADRLVQQDEYGELRITERGEEHLRHLKAEGHLLGQHSHGARHL